MCFEFECSLSADFWEPEEPEEPEKPEEPEEPEAEPESTAAAEPDVQEPEPKADPEPEPEPEPETQTEPETEPETAAQQDTQEEPESKAEPVSGVAAEPTDAETAPRKQPKARSKYFGNASAFPLHAAAANDDMDELQQALHQAAWRCAMRDARGHTALDWAAQHGCTKAAVLLLQRGADACAVDGAGNTVRAAAVCRT